MLPPLTVTMPESGGGSFTISVPATMSYLNVQSSAGQTQICPNVLPASALGPAGEIPTILGNPIMRAYVTIFDLENERIGFAPQTGCAD